MDLTKYRTVFIEEATEHLSDMSSALLALEKDVTNADAIDVIFRMAHGIKGMAASLEYASITEISHRVEDHMMVVRDDGSVSGGDMALLFSGLDALEAMVGIVRETGEAPAPDCEHATAFLEAQARFNAAEAAPVPKKKSPDPVEPALPAHAAAPEPPTPPPSVRVQTETLDRFLGTVGEVILGSAHVRTVAGTEQAKLSPGLTAGLDRMDRATGDLQRRALELRTAPLQRIVEPLPRMAREIAHGAGKRVQVEIRNAEIELDRSILDRLSDPLVHLFRNAVDHGIEAPAVRLAAGKPEIGRIVVDARRERDRIHISVSDDGGGIDLDRLRALAVKAGIVPADLAEDLPPETVASFIFRAGMTTADAVSDVSGRGVGMDAVRATIESLGGQVDVHTEKGLGTTTTLAVPITAAVQRVLLLRVCSAIVAIPVAKIERIVEVPTEIIECAGREAFALVDDEPVPVLDLAAQLRLGSSEPKPVTVLVLADVRGDVMALRVDAIAGQQQIYVKPVPELLASRKALAGLVLLGEGQPVFLLDINQFS